MITPNGMKGKHIAVFGLARTGIVAVKALVAAGAHVYAWDDNADRCAEVADHVHNLYDLDFTKLDQLIIAPGVPLTHPVPHKLVQKAHEFKVPVRGDFDLFADGQQSLPRHKTVAITGTNGKSTTTALIAHMIKYAGLPVVMGGNIGTGVLSLPELDDGGVYVLEMSSYQIDLTYEFAPDIAVLLNITPDHLDRHGDMNGYVAAKARLFDLLPDAGLAIIGVDDDYAATMSNGVANKGKRISQISSSERSVMIRRDGISVSDGMLFRHQATDLTMVGTVDNCKSLSGAHNSQNMAAAFAVGQELGLASDVILESFKTFPGLEHRQEIVATKDGITFVNDSKATNQEGAAKALSSFKNIIWIAGGRAKNPDLQEVQKAVTAVKQAYFIGESGELFTEAMQDFVPSERSQTLDKAFELATQIAEEGDVILLSPAAASFDQFKDFEARGDAFKTLVTNWKGKQS